MTRIARPEVNQKAGPEDLMTRIVRAEVKQNEDAREALGSTGNKHLTEIGVHDLNTIHNQHEAYQLSCPDPWTTKGNCWVP